MCVLFFSFDGFFPLNVFQNNVWLALAARIRCNAAFGVCVALNAWVVSMQNLELLHILSTLCKEKNLRQCIYLRQTIIAKFTFKKRRFVHALISLLRNSCIFSTTTNQNRFACVDFSMFSFWSQNAIFFYFALYTEHRIVASDIQIISCAQAKKYPNATFVAFFTVEHAADSVQRAMQRAKVRWLSFKWRQVETASQHLCRSLKQKSIIPITLFFTHRKRHTHPRECFSLLF